MLPKQGTLERVFLEKIKQLGQVSYLDFVGTGINMQNIDQIAKNLQNGMYESEDDDSLKFDV